MLVRESPGVVTIKRFPVASPSNTTTPLRRRRRHRRRHRPERRMGGRPTPAPQSPPRHRPPPLPCVPPGRGVYCVIYANIYNNQTIPPGKIECNYRYEYACDQHTGEGRSLARWWRHRAVIG